MDEQLILVRHNESSYLAEQVAAVEPWTMFLRGQNGMNRNILTCNLYWQMRMIYKCTGRGGTCSNEITNFT